MDAEIGTVIRGTMRAEHLVPALLGKLEELNPERAAQVIRDEAMLPLCPSKHTDMDRWARDNPGAADCLLNVLFDALRYQAPPGCYFGSHPGDSSDIGFWEHEPEPDHNTLEV